MRRTRHPVLPAVAMAPTGNLALHAVNALLDQLPQRGRDLFAAEFDVVLHDRTSTSFKNDPPLQILA